MDDREEWTDDDRRPGRADGLMKLPQDATRSEWEDESEWLQSRMHRANPTPRPAPPQAPAGPKASAPVQGGLPPPLEASPAAGIDDAAIGQRGTAGAGFGAPCNAHAPCSSALGLACVVRRSSVEGGWPSRSSVSGPRSTRRSSDSTRRVSSAIRLGRKAEASRRLRLSLDEHGAALRDNRVPRHPPRYIKTKPREQSPQADGRVLKVGWKIKKKDATAKVPRGKQAQKEAGGHQTSPVRQLESKGDLLLKMLNEAEVKVSVERHGSSAFTESKSRSAGRHPRLSSFSISWVPFPASTHRPSYWENKAESTGTEDSFMKEVRFRMRATNKQGLAQKGPVSTDVIPSNAGAGGHEDKTTRNVIDRSQQVSDELGGGTKRDYWSWANNFP
ncbi:hypothetical protein HPB48_014782 [Haemaphysalis longicornis]|uniref:Uncharacterized protein n=1 Tax=Haemaphysalis longicornis TaxID=44386 RepID=A0A9J6GDN1_HAELO|nr:hypothetical protein HPB48_014782 [Haemaphysalis longicornis]